MRQILVKRSSKIYIYIYICNKPIYVPIIFDFSFCPQKMNVPPNDGLEETSKIADLIEYVALLLLLFRYFLKLDHQSEFVVSL